MKDFISLIIFALFFICINLRILYLAKKDNYQREEYSFYITHNTIINIFPLIISIIFVFFTFSTIFPYHQIAKIICSTTFFPTQIFIAFRHSQHTKKTGQLIPYFILMIILMFSIIIQSFG
jgi:hypothetical protein